MKLIIAINNKNYIGKDGKLFWRSSGDLKHFKEKTMGQKLLVGRTTYENMPKLEGREMLVVGTGYLTLEEALAKNPDWVIGGASIYKQTQHLCDEYHISHINNNDDGDTLAPTFDIVGKTYYHYYFD